ncbi:hypothetical protein CC80DRAFT_592688 [Byssothecium circinans]|uniref:Fungal N-terminal domain-containing protein n=1 Tax=Byssothecium circinans TaxID=147558 RepID=A0A6A5U0E0_9PLEO|nr:hypothetical protein CC80DRAFT_592688 [Byssothecium circinans]
MSGLSIGDILMLSQTAWKLGRTFSAGRKNAPPEFLEVEAEVNGLAKALKLLAETMFSEEVDQLKDAEKDVQVGFAAMLSSCRQTVQDLDSLTDQYQDIKKSKTNGGFTVERSWSELVVAQYQTMMWTTDGGDIKALRRMLRTHTSTLSQAKQALQSHDLSRLESIVAPESDQVDSFHSKLAIHSQELNEAVRIVQNDADQPFQPVSPSESKSPKRESSQQDRTSPDSFADREPVPQTLSYTSSPQEPTRSPTSSTIRASSLRSPAPSTNRPARQNGLAESRSARTSSSGAPKGPGSSRGSHPVSITDIVESSKPSASPSARSRSPEQRCLWEIPQAPDSIVLSSKVSPTIMDYPVHHEAKDDVQESRTSDLDINSTIHGDVHRRHRSSTIASQQERFWKDATRNSAQLCKARGIVVQYAQKVSPDPDIEEVEMVDACGKCDIHVVRKREAIAEARNDIRIMTSIWVLSDDKTLRMELKMADGGWYIPYSSYFNPEKVSITVPCELKFHDVQYGTRLLKTVKTTWINYVFESAQAAALFQNELMGRTLLRTFRTCQTLRIREGLSGTFSYAEQMCGMENLRIWEDNETLAVIALIHFSPQFKKGYLAFYLNSSNNPIKAKDEGPKEIKIKGLWVPLEKGAGRKDSVIGGEGKDRKGNKGKKAEGVDRKKVITGAKVEFASEAEKREFLALVWQVQGCMRDLPPLSGVN